LKLIIRGIRRAGFAKVWRAAKRVAKEHKRITLFVFTDMAWCVVRYGAGYVDYEIFEFGRIRGGRRRKTFVTQGNNERMVRELNEKTDYHLLVDKGESNRLFSDFIRRDWLDLRRASVEEFSAFAARHEYIIVKPADGMCGKGIEKIATQETNANDLFSRLTADKKFVVEQCVEQHPDVAALYPHSVNTMRLVSIMDDSGEVHIVFRAMRLGAGGGVVDNFNSGGMFVLVGEDGTISSDAINKETTIFTSHPDTGVRFVDTKIPFYTESVEMVRYAASKIPKLRYVGWDVAVTNDGPLLIEVNQHPGHDILQSKVYLRDNDKGVLPVFKKAINGELKK
jgi:hypothetical protein